MKTIVNLVLLGCGLGFLSLRVLGQNMPGVSNAAASPFSLQRFMGGNTTPSSNNPVVATVEISGTNLHAGDIFELQVQVRIVAGYYVYATNDPAKPYDPTTVKFTLPESITALGEWVPSPPQSLPTGIRIYREGIRFHRRFQISPQAPPQTILLTGRLDYEPCTDEECLPASTLPLSARVVFRSPGK